MKQLLKILLFSLIFISCSSLKPKKIDSKSNYFPSKNNKNVVVIVNKKVDPQRLKTLLIVPNSDYYLELGKNLNFFNQVMTFSQLEDEIIKAGLAEDVGTISNKLGLSIASKKLKPFVILHTTQKHKPKLGLYRSIILYDPQKGENIFENEIKINLMWGRSDKRTIYPLYNSLLDYLRNQ